MEESETASILFQTFEPISNNSKLVDFKEKNISALKLIKNDINENLSPNGIQFCCEKENNISIKKCDENFDAIKLNSRNLKIADEHSVMDYDYHSINDDKNSDFDFLVVPFVKNFDEVNFTEILSSKNEIKTKECYICDVCRKQFSSKSSLSVHYGSHPQTNLHKCNLCDEVFVQASDFADHFAQHCIQEEYDCVTCDETFTLKAEFEAHMQSHTLQIKDHKCDLCQMVFGSLADLFEHEKLHTIKPHICLICNKTFRLKSSLNRHILTHGEKKPFQCDICHRGFTQKITLNKHFLGHKKIKPFNCELCPKSFTSKPSLELHYVNHSGVKPYVCLVCDRSFTSKRNLKRHGLEHMPGQRGTCDVCGKTFNTKSKLNLHSLVHTNDRPFKCVMCNRGFTYSSHLKRHIMWHNNERPFVCEICGKDFPTRFRLTGHLQKHQAEFDFEPFAEAELIDADDDITLHDLESGSSNLELACNRNIEVIYADVTESGYDDTMTILGTNSLNFD